MGSPGDVARSVLIIEDDDRIRRIVSITLPREGLEVTEAASGEAAPRRWPSGRTTSCCWT